MAATTVKVVKIAKDTSVSGSASYDSPCATTTITPEKVGERKKYLTMKYGQHQMKLVKKRIAIEDWVDDELMDMFDIQDTDNDTYPCEVDLDIILDLDTDEKRTEALWELLHESKKPRDQIQEFIMILLSKLNTI